MGFDEGSYVVVGGMLVRAVGRSEGFFCVVGALLSWQPEIQQNSEKGSPSNEMLGHQRP